MGRETTCLCQWASLSGQCKVLLESRELILRGEIRRRIPIASVTDLAVEGDKLRFHAGDVEVALCLGSAMAQAWAKRITALPPTLAAKLGILPETRLLVLGEVESEELQAAIQKGLTTDGPDATMIVARLRTIIDLDYAVHVYAAYPANPPLWVVYPKGARTLPGEAEIRSTLRFEGFIDTKVASVSEELTALRFIKRP